MTHTEEDIARTRDFQKALREYERNRKIMHLLIFGAFVCSGVSIAVSVVGWLMG